MYGVAGRFKYLRALFFLAHDLEVEILKVPIPKIKSNYLMPSLFSDFSNLSAKVTDQKKP
jgi:hypothetical protein